MERQAKDSKRQTDQAASQCPTAWFAVLEDARNRNDFRRAAYAEEQLERLGVRVTFSRKGATR